MEVYRKNYSTLFSLYYNLNINYFSYSALDDSSNSNSKHDKIFKTAPYLNGLISDIFGFP